MKRIASLILCMILVLSLVSFAGCGAKETQKDTLKFGMGIHAYIDKVKNADGDQNGSAEAVVSVAAVLLDKDGKIVKCVLDTAANAMSFTAEGKFVEASEFKTKGEAGDAYGMKAYGGAAKEWYEQADAMAALVVGKTVDEVKALMATDGKGTDDVINAGCTIVISDFVLAIEKAVKNAVDSTATEDATLQLGVVSTQTGSKDATAESDGVNEVDTSVVAAALSDGKIVVSATDALQAKLTFTAAGAATVESGAAVDTKKDKGTGYGMAQYGTDLNGDGTVKEFFEQAAAFDAACAGKTAAELAALAVDTGYGNADLQAAGCTVNVGDMVKAAVKAATVA